MANTEKTNQEVNADPKPPKIVNTRFDWQGHRGARGLVPENSIPAFLEALRLYVPTLELDVAVSKDKKIIVSHEPWMSHHICSKFDGTPVTEEEAMSLKLYEMTYEEIKRYDCGSRGNERFPYQEKMAAFKPSLEDVVHSAALHCNSVGMAMPNFNIEIKSHPDGDNVFTPPPAEFADLLLAELKRYGIYKQSNIQSFDVRPLQYIRKVAPDMPLAFLVENEDGIDKNMERLGFTPEIYSPEHILLDSAAIDKLHQMGMKVIPWTVNEEERMKELKAMGVDGIITDYPNLIQNVR